MDNKEQHLTPQSYPSMFSQDRYSFSSFAYDSVVWIFTIIFDIFFREIKTRGSFNVPKKGPVILVCAPHSNQFVDPTIIMLQIRHQIGRRISWLIAAKSYRKQFIGFMAKLAGAIPVERSQDLLKTASGQIMIENQVDNATVVTGKDTKFTTECMVKGLIGLPHSAGSTQIEEIISDTKLIIRKPFKNSSAKKMLTSGTSFKSAPKIDNADVFQHVFTHLHSKGIVGIFPEGGSHDRTDLLPLKAGVAIMALGASAADLNCEVKIVPCGLNYFHADRFRSRAVIEFGVPLHVTVKDGLAYKEDTRKATGDLLDKITLALKSVTVQTPDYDTLMLIQAVRRLYTFQKRGRTPLPLVIDMNRRLTIGYDKYKDDPRVINLREMVLDYNSKLFQLGLRDHQVELASTNKLNCSFMLINRIVRIVCLSFLCLPGTILFSPVFAAAKIISKRKAKEALNDSSVKIKARDVVATWKILVALALAPFLYTIYSFFGVIICAHYNILPNFNKVVKFFICFAFLVSTTYSAFRIGEVGIDIFKSIKPLVLSLSSSKDDQLSKLKETRKSLSLKVTELCNDLGPEVFSDFGRFHKAVNDSIEGAQVVDIDDTEVSDTESIKSSLSKASSNAISRVNSARNLSDVPIFSYYSPRSGSPFIDDIAMKDDVSTGLELPTSQIGIRIRNAMLKKQADDHIDDNTHD